MKKNKVDILGVKFDSLTINEANSAIVNLAKRGATNSSAIVVEPYVEFLTLAKKNKEIRDILNTADLCLADGTSIQWAGSYLYGKPSQSGSYWSIKKSLLFSLQNPRWRSQVFPEKMAGVTQTKRLLTILEQQNIRVGVIGGDRPKEVSIELKKLYPKLKLIEVWHGYFSGAREEKIVHAIKKAKLDVLFVAMGFPKQELFMSKYRTEGLAKVMIGEGGSFDYNELGGPIKRAPRWLQKTGLEWFWRLIRQPSRIRRQLAILKFTRLIRIQKKNQK